MSTFVLLHALVHTHTLYILIHTHIKKKKLALGPSRPGGPPLPLALYSLELLFLPPSLSYPHCRQQPCPDCSSAVGKLQPWKHRPLLNQVP